MISIIADWCGIISLALTVILLFRSESMRKEIESQQSDYIKEQKAIRGTLIALRNNVIDDQLLNAKIVSDIRTQLFGYQQKFKRLLSIRDKRHINKYHADMHPIDKCHDACFTSLPAASGRLFVSPLPLSRQCGRILAEKGGDNNDPIKTGVRT